MASLLTFLSSTPPSHPFLVHDPHWKHHWENTSSSDWILIPLLCFVFAGVQPDLEQWLLLPLQILPLLCIKPPFQSAILALMNHQWLLCSLGYALNSSARPSSFSMIPPLTADLCRLISYHLPWLFLCSHPNPSLCLCKCWPPAWGWSLYWLRFAQILARFATLAKIISNPEYPVLGSGPAVSGLHDCHFLWSTVTLGLPCHSRPHICVSCCWLGGQKSGLIICSPHRPDV